MKARTILYTCPGCGTEYEVKVWPIIPAQTYGPPENCYPEEGGDIDGSCPNCNVEPDQAKCYELAGDDDRDYGYNED